MRGIPIFTFMNKLDRPARDPLELLDELKSVLGIARLPGELAAGQRRRFRGVFDRKAKRCNFFERVAMARRARPNRVGAGDDPQLLQYVSARRSRR